MKIVEKINKVYDRIHRWLYGGPPLSTEVVKTRIDQSFVRLYREIDTLKKLSNNAQNR